MPELECVEWECPECSETHEDPEWRTHCRVCGLIVTVMGENCVISHHQYVPVEERGPEAFPGQRAQYYASLQEFADDAPVAGAETRFLG